MIKERSTFTSPVNRGSVGLADLFEDDGKDVSLANCGARTANFFSRHGWSLIYFSVFHEQNRFDALHLHIGVPDDIATMCKEFQSRGGCPLARETFRLIQPFDALSHDYSAYDDELSRRYLKAFGSLGFAKTLAIPVQLGKGVALFALGGDPALPDTMPEELVVTTAYQLIIDLVARHPEISAYFEPKRLTRREAEILGLTAGGLTEQEIAEALQISPNTVRTHIENAKRNLGAANKTHAVALAISAREINTLSF